MINKDLYKPKRLIAAKHCIIGLNPSQINKYQSGSTMYSENVQHILKNLVKKQAYIENSNVYNYNYGYMGYEICKRTFNYFYVSLESENNIIRDSSKHNVSMFGGKRRHRRSTKEIVPVVPVAAKVFVTNEQKKPDLPDFLLPTRPTRRVIFKRKKKYPVFNPFHSLDVKLLLIAVIIYLVYFNL